MISNQFHQMAVFVAVAETQAFSAGARRLNISAPAATRAIAAMEQRLGVRLFDRTTRYVRVTQAGMQFLDDSRRILGELEVSENALLGRAAKPAGELGVTAPVLFGERYLSPCIAEYLERYPETSVNAVFLDRPVNLLEEGLDVGIRIGELHDSNLRSRRIGTVRILTCAAPDYLVGNGIPEVPASLAEHTIIGSNTSSSFDWRFGESRSIPLKPRLIVNNNTAAIESAVRGLGITRALSYQVVDELKSGKLVTILDEHEPAPVPVSIVHREAPYPSTRVRAFIDLLVNKIVL